MNATHYRFTEAALPVAEIRQTEARRMAGQSCRMGSLRHPVIDWQAWWRQLYRVLVQLLLVTRTILRSLFALAGEQLFNLKRYLMIKEELLAEAFYEAMDSFFVMDTEAEIHLITEPFNQQNFVTSGERFLHYAAATAGSFANIFSLSHDFNKNIAKANKSASWILKRNHDKIRSHEAKSPNIWFWKRWIGDATGLGYLNILMRRLWNFRQKPGHPEIGADCLKC
ncbi:MAG: hypothetical protein EOM83_07515 [Clostridia bacterium]|nr:hypothetical protein [Clostridia bacterium]